LASASVSRRHAQIIWDRADFVLVDLGSSNGTQLNGVEVSRAVLQTADRLTLGDVVLEFAPEIVPLSIGVGAVVA
jgi:pSer/pThr/pTyr-binding forkhead associated (FHA) protein